MTRPFFILVSQKSSESCTDKGRKPTQTDMFSNSVEGSVKIVRTDNSRDFRLFVVFDFASAIVTKCQMCDDILLVCDM